MIGRMIWRLAQRPRGAAASEVQIDASTPGEAIEQLRAQIPSEDVMLYVARVHEVEMPAS
jgi:hypothetical protein